MGSLDRGRGWLLVVDFEPSAAAADYTKRMRAFLDEKVLPAEAGYEAFRAERRGTPAEWDLPPVVEELKAEARARGLWNLFLPSVSGLSNLEYAPVAEVSGWSPVIAPEAINCAAPDTGNMETLHLFGTPEQKAEWLEPLLEGRIRSAFAMTEPDVASSDATNVQTSIRRDGDEYVISGQEVVDLRDRRRAVRGVHRDGQDRPGRRPPTGSSRWCWCPGTPRAWRSSGTCRCSATRTSTGTPSWSSTTSGCRCRTCSARRAAASRSPRPGSAPAASTTACG